MPEGTALRAPAGVPTLQDALALGLTDREYELVCEKQGRPPNQVELAVYSLMWSEHCAYKHSKLLLRTLPTEGEHVALGPGENAGAVTLPGGLVCAFKVESHNHPSAVEPFQGAATGVGGILRDIFALGARPIAVLDSLRFGEPSTAVADRARFLLDGAVGGIGHYGNSIGVPTVGGEVYFEAPYEHNCLVNAMALGLARREQLIRSAAAGPGNLVVLFGASTGRDGIGGASVLASAELAGEEGAAPTCAPPSRWGIPSRRRSCSSAPWSCSTAGLLVSLQDLGAAGLTSSASEMASKGGVGIDIDVAAVPLREPGLEPFEIMVSESQERMLCVVEPAAFEQVAAVCARWEIACSAIGRVTDSRRLRVLQRRGAARRHARRGAGGRVPAVRAVAPSARRRASTPRRSGRCPPRPVPARRCWRCSGAPTSPPAGRCSSSTTRSSSHVPSAVPARPTRPCWRSPTARRWPSASTATAAGSRPTPTGAPSRRSWSAPRTSPAPAPSRSARPTTSTSATPRRSTSPGS